MTRNKHGVANRMRLLKLAASMVDTDIYRLPIINIVEGVVEDIVGCLDGISIKFGIAVVCQEAINLSSKQHVIV